MSTQDKQAHYHNPGLKVKSINDIQSQTFQWKSPSNIALIKYWGKFGQQLPRNPSISLTLNNAATKTSLKFSTKKSAALIDLAFFFEGKERKDFAQRIEKLLSSLLPIFPFLEQFHLKIESSNSFPHSAGIASSASAMSALALCLCSMEKHLFNTLQDQEDFLQKASYIARLGSGSASRSVYPHIAIWGQHPKVSTASNLFAIPFANEVDSVFKNFHDDILIISKKEKSVSSGAGHDLMNNNLYANNRYLQANQRFERLITAMKEGDLATFGQITEAEALSLHALMMTSTPPYLLMEPNSIAAIRAVQNYRHETKHPLYFTLDAGPNLHLLYPDSIASDVQEFIKTDLQQYCEQGVYIADFCGDGSKEIKLA